jgi:hypothetical protein
MIMLFAILATEMFSFLAEGIDKRVEAYVEADVRRSVSDKEGHDGVAIYCIENGDQDEESVGCLVLECEFQVVGACD